MRALVLAGDGVALERGRPALVAAPDEVVVDVAYAGVCRSDLAAIAGDVVVPRGRVIGHELAGWADGERVTVVPFAACGACTACARGERCPALRWLGVDRDGAFADHVCVPRASLVRVPVELPLVLAAYVEPVAAALGVLPACPRGARVLVAGAGRIAELTARVLAAHGASVTRAPAGDVYDVVIEHGGNPAALLAHVRPGGTLVLKSRAHRSLALDAGELVARDLVIRGASHGSFAAAVDWLCSGRIVVADLIAPAQPLEAYAAVLAAARASEQSKQMFAIRPERG